MKKVMTVVDPKGAQFEFQSQGLDNFEKDFVELVDTTLPLFAVKNKLLHLMEVNGRPQFKIPKFTTRDGEEHIFYFDVLPITESRSVKVYRYKGYS
ncbi:DUF5960 family protein [Listeria aquatica]|uniref:Uncharacterized protein n=2 Tax=Listeria aquatica TaxID=1494960 RepID=W7BMV2_9LIST|nr:DUF5960 family protein [Listeria aquatica]EUJ21293.1 hypothetical protein MAQA_00972 [Listeria aquatica FSL S10-1188]MBC1522133.1 hypothetical protein [Listeria aquatica]